METGRTKIKIANSLERTFEGFPFFIIFSLIRKKRKNFNHSKEAIGRLLAYLNLFSTSNDRPRIATAGATQASDRRLHERDGRKMMDRTSRRTQRHNARSLGRWEAFGGGMPGHRNLHSFINATALLHG